MKKRKTLIALLAILGGILIGTGATYAWFSYGKTGTKQHTITSGAIKFKYTEDNQGIILNDAMPMTDAQGKAQSNYFEFTIDSKTSSTTEIPYDITVRRSGTGTNMDSVVKVYLTKLVTTNNTTTEQPIEILTGKQVAKVSELAQYLNATLNIDASKNERKLFNEVVPADSSDYSETYRLRMWIDYETQFLVQQDGQPDSYPYNGKTYTLTVNVYGVGAAATASTPTMPNYLSWEPGFYSYDGQQYKTWQQLNAYGLNKTDIENGTTASYFTPNSTPGILVLPSDITTIGASAFDGSGDTVVIVVPSSVTTIGSSAFDRIKGVIYEGEATDSSNWGALSLNPYIENGFVYSDNTKTNLVSYIGSDTTIVIPSGVTTINKFAFYSSKLTSVTIPNTVTSIGNYAFYSSTHLTNVTLANGSQLASIGQFAFGSCGQLTSITIPSSVTNISGHAFAFAGLTSATFAETSNWSVAGTGAISATDLADPSTAATYLKTTYANNVWTRTTN